MELKFKINLTEGQKEAYNEAMNDDVRYLTLCYSRQSGKSTLMKVLCIKWLFESKRDIAYICRNYILAKKLFKDMVKLFPQEFLKSSNASDLTITSKFNSTLTFFSAESGNSLRGLTFTYLILDEFAFFKNDMADGSNLWYDVLFPTIKVKGRKIIFVSTPLGKNNIFADMYFRGLSDEFPHYSSILKTIYDDNLVTKEEIENIKKQIPSISFKQEFECQFLDSSLTYFQGFEKCFKPINKYNNRRTWIGVDLSSNGKDETILTKINNDNQVAQWVIKGSLDQKYQQIANLINSSENLQGAYIESNGVGSPMINEITKLSNRKSLIHPWTTTNASKNEILSSLAVEISKRSLIFNDKDKELFSQFGTFIVKHTKSGKMQLEASGSNKDDRILSLAFALRAKQDFKSVSSPSFVSRPRGLRIE